MPVVIGKARNEVFRPCAPKPCGKRLCDRAATFLVAHVIQPLLAPRALQPTPQRSLRGHENSLDGFFTSREGGARRAGL